MDDSTRLHGRTALVTGAAGGIGAAIVRDLAELDASVAVCDINRDRAAEVAAEVGSAAAFGADLAIPPEIERLVSEVTSQLGPIDIFVSNAGIERVGPFAGSDPESWDNLIAVNLRAPLLLTRLLLPGMLERRRGRLVFISSEAARAGSSGEAVYSACKAGVNGFSRSIAREAAGAGVTCNVVSPGPTNTDLLQSAFEQHPRKLESLARLVPMRRLGEPADVSALVAFLCTAQAGFITGQTVSVSGGLTMY